MLVQYLSAFTACIIVALISEWRLTLLLLILAPFLAVTAYFTTMVRALFVLYASNYAI